MYTLSYLTPLLNIFMLTQLASCVKFSIHIGQKVRSLEIVQGIAKNEHHKDMCSGKDAVSAQMHVITIIGGTW